MDPEIYPSEVVKPVGQDTPVPTSVYPCDPCEGQRFTAASARTAKAGVWESHVWFAMQA